jgi:hypothetical protein
MSVLFGALQFHHLVFQDSAYVHYIHQFHNYHKMGYHCSMKLGPWTDDTDNDNPFYDNYGIDEYNEHTQNPEKLNDEIEAHQKAPTFLTDDTIHRPTESKLMKQYNNEHQIVFDGLVS